MEIKLPCRPIVSRQKTDKNLRLTTLLFEQQTGLALQLLPPTPMTLMGLQVSPTRPFTLSALMPRPARIAATPEDLA